MMVCPWDDCPPDCNDVAPGEIRCGCSCHDDTTEDDQ